MFALDYSFILKNSNFLNYFRIKCSLLWIKIKDEWDIKNNHVRLSKICRWKKGKGGLNKNGKVLHGLIDVWERVGVSKWELMRNREKMSIE